MLIALLACLVGPAVLPGPPSGPIQPPGMICLGACAGPVIYGPAEQRGRLVVACDMTSDTCSDGRRITTTRATPVPCETSPGVWTEVGVDQGCYSVRGLESWAANTSYLSWGAELDRSPWQAVEGATISGRILSGPTGSARLLQGGLPPEAGTWTLACRMRALSGDSSRLRIFQTGGTGGSTRSVSVGADWATYSETWEIGGEPSAMSVHIYPDGSTLEIAGCWLTRTDTPGRPCWGGEAPVTCAADQHTIRTEGWPTEAGEVCVTATMEETYSTWRAVLGGGGGLRLEARPARLELNGLTPANLQVSAPPMERGKAYRYCAGRRDGTAYVSRDGVVLGSIASDPLSWPEEILVGRTTHWSGQTHSLRIRGFE